MKMGEVGGSYTGLTRQSMGKVCGITKIVGSNKPHVPVLSDPLFSCEPVQWPLQQQHQEYRMGDVK